MVLGALKTWLSRPDLNQQSNLIARIFAYFLSHKQAIKSTTSDTSKTPGIPKSPKLAVSSSSTREMHLSVGLRAIQQLSSSPRVPAIKFIGRHGEVPRYDSNISHMRGSSSGGSNVTIDELDLPYRFRRRLPSPEEIAMVNSGGLREL